MSFIVPAPKPSETEPEINPGPFWPPVDPAKIRDEHGIDGTTSAVRLRMTLIEAIAATNGELRAWRESRQAEGIAKLVDIEADMIDDVSILVHRYYRAIGVLTKAILIERFRDFDSTAAGDKKADRLAETIDDLRRDHHFAIADIVGARRTTVELI